MHIRQGFFYLHAGVHFLSFMPNVERRTLRETASIGGLSQRSFAIGSRSLAELSPTRRQCIGATVESSSGYTPHGIRCGKALNERVHFNGGIHIPHVNAMLYMTCVALTKLSSIRTANCGICALPCGRPPVREHTLLSGVLYSSFSDRKGHIQLQWSSLQRLYNVLFNRTSISTEEQNVAGPH